MTWNRYVKFSDVLTIKHTHEHGPQHAHHLTVTVEFEKEDDSAYFSFQAKINSFDFENFGSKSLHEIAEHIAFDLPITSLEMNVDNGQYFVGVKRPCAKQRMDSKVRESSLRKPVHRKTKV